MERPSAGAVAWGTLVAGVAAYEYLAPEGELMSQCVDRGLEGRYKYLVVGSIALTAAHLLNTFERVGAERFDPFSTVGRIIQNAKGRNL